MRRTVFLTTLILLLGSMIASAQPMSLSGGNSDLVTLEPQWLNDTLAPGDSTLLAVRFVVDERYHIQSNDPTEDWIIPTELTVQVPDGFEVGEIRYPPHTFKSFDFAEDTKLAVLESGTVIVAEIKALPDAVAGEQNFEVELFFQPCDDQQCLPPQITTSSITLTVGEETSPDSDSGIFDDIPEEGAAGLATYDSGSGPANYFQTLVTERGWLILILAVFVAGLGLSLTPCVFPLIPITVGFFRGQASDNKRRTVALAITYVAGIATTYSVLGVFAASSGALFGAWLSSPWVLGTLAFIIAAMGLSMFGLFEIRPPAFLTQHSGGKRGFGGAYGMGLVFGVVAAPCTGPATIALLAFVGALANPVLGFLLFFALSIGLATPLLFLAIFSGNLPQSGVWMDWVKKLMGALLLGVAIWLLLPVMGTKNAVLAGGALAVVVGFWLGFMEKSGFKPTSLGVVRVLTGIAAVGFGVWMLIPKPEMPGIVWEPYSPERVEQARQEGRPVIIDFTADWCAPCHELEAGAFRYPEAVEVSEQFVRLKADVTDSRTQEARAALDAFSVRGVPTIVFIRPDGREVGDARIMSNVHGRVLVENMRQTLETTASLE